MFDNSMKHLYLCIISFAEKMQVVLKLLRLGRFYKEDLIIFLPIYLCSSWAECIKQRKPVLEGGLGCCQLTAR